MRRETPPPTPPWGRLSPRPPPSLPPPLFDVVVTFSFFLSRVDEFLAAISVPPGTHLAVLLNDDILTMLGARPRRGWEGGRALAGGSPVLMSGCFWGFGCSRQSFDRARLEPVVHPSPDHWKTCV